MGLTERGRRAWIATAIAVVIGGGGVAIGAAAFRSSATGPAPAAAATSAPPPASAPAGVGIVAVTPGGPADRAVIRSGDVIRSFGRTPTPDMESLTEALAGARPGQTVTLTIARDDQTLRIGVRLGELPGG